ncbi:uncharacterized protein [Temnothorax nylanderi]|uniref:uncharacterized protein isoform X2 n=1 Tax=Temnothorax nylanderi TaxID=102681 RepID=UPI003A8A0C8B
MRHRRRTTERRRRRPGGHQVTAKQSSDQCSVSNSAVAHRPLLVELDNKAQVTQLLGDEKSSTRCGSRSSLANIEREQSHEERPHTHAFECNRTQANSSLPLV